MQKVCNREMTQWSSCRRPELGSQHPHWAAVTLAPNLTPFLASRHLLSHELPFSNTQNKPEKEREISRSLLEDMMKMYFPSQLEKLKEINNFLSTHAKIESRECKQHNEKEDRSNN